MHPLIGVRELERRLGELALFDIRWALTDPNHGIATYEAGHIPGAVFVDLDRDLSAEPGPGRHPLPEPEVFVETLGRLGISPESDVVVYDDMGGAVAARMWWMLRSIGHQGVRLLDGGYQAWTEAGHPIETGRNDSPNTRYPTVERFDGVAERDHLENRQIVDVRASERYRGDVEPVDPYPGHIPGAINIPLALNLEDNGRFRKPEALADIYAGLSHAVISCGSGVNACHTALAMTVAGLGTPDVYVGSYSEWSNLGLPVNSGDDP